MNLHSLAILLILPAAASAQQWSVVSTNPERGMVAAEPGSSISVTFDRPIDPDTIELSSFHAFSRGAGPPPGSFLVSKDGRTVALDPIRDASHGEPVTVTIVNAVRGLDGSSLRSRGHQFRHWTGARTTSMEFEIVQSITTSAFPGEQVIPYGGTATDLDGDGWIDLSIVNEETNDVRVFMSSADGTCRIDDFLQPGNPVGAVPSPSEAADSDLDGDGDLDIASTAYYSSTRVFLHNDGSGVFGDPTTFEAGIGREWSLKADDMNGDGLFDLVVGGQNQVRVLVAQPRVDSPPEARDP